MNTRIRSTLRCGAMMLTIPVAAVLIQIPAGAAEDPDGMVVTASPITDPRIAWREDMRTTLERLREELRSDSLAAVRGALEGPAGRERVLLSARDRADRG